MRPKTLSSGGNTMKVDHSSAKIYIPAPGSCQDQQIIPGSGIVGIPHATVLKLYLEGNKYGAVNLHEPYERIACAFGRLATNYPTSAILGVLDFDLDNMIEVGEIFWPNEIHIRAEKRREFDEYMARYCRQN